MVTKFRTLIFFIGLISIHSRCSRDEYDCQGYTTYVFNTSGNHFVPESDSIRIGDTLKVIYDEPDHPIDINTGKVINYSNAENYSNYLSIHHLDTNGTGNWTRALTSTFLNYGNEKGKIEIDSRFKDKTLDVFPTISKGRFQYTIWYVFKEKGVYSISFNDVSPVYQKNDVSKTCEGAYFNVGVKNLNCHKELYIRYRPDYKLMTNVEKFHLYCFEVY